MTTILTFDNFGVTKLARLFLGRGEIGGQKGQGGTDLPVRGLFHLGKAWLTDDERRSSVPLGLRLRTAASCSANHSKEASQTEEKRCWFWRAGIRSQCGCVGVEV